MHRSHSSNELAVTSVVRMKVTVPTTMSAVPVGSWCDTAEHNVRLRPPPEGGPYSGGAANGRCSGGGRAWQVGGSDRPQGLHVTDAVGYLPDAISVVLTRRESQHHATRWAWHAFQETFRD